MTSFIEHNGLLLVVAALALLNAAVRWIRTRRALFRAIDAVNEILRAENAGDVDVFRTPRMRRLLTLSQAAARLEGKIERLGAHLAQRQVRLGAAAVPR